MKKILFGIALILCMSLAAACGNQKKEAVVEEEVMELVDTVDTPAAAAAPEEVVAE